MSRIVDEREGVALMPLSEFPEAERLEIERLVSLPTPPPKWKSTIGGLYPSRARYEWHAARAGRREEIPAPLRREVIARDGRVCQLCGDAVPEGPGEIHIDHVFPLSRGGATVLENLQVTHAACNIAKGAKCA